MANSSARIYQNATTAPLLACQKREGSTVESAASAEPLASQKSAEKPVRQAISMAGQKKRILASHEREKDAVKVKAPQGNGQKSKTIKLNGLTFRVRLSDRGYRVMLLSVEEGRQREPYLVSLRSAEWEVIQGDETAFLALVKSKLCQRIEKAFEEEKGKLLSLLKKVEQA